MSLVGAGALAGVTLVGGPAPASATSGPALSAPTAVGDTATCTKYPLQYDHWYGRNDGTVRSHSGINPADREGVKRVQRALNASIAAELDVDGYFGPATETATRQLQRVLNDVHTGPTLVVDGKFGKRTFFATADYGWWEQLCG